jgi:hypothetical protein
VYSTYGFEKNVKNYVEKWEQLHTVGGNVNYYSYFRKLWSWPKKLEMKLV